MLKKKKKLSIIIPVYNEKDLVIDLIKMVKNVSLDGIEKEIIVIDDSSTDGSTEILKKEGEKFVNKIFFHQKNQGKGAAIRTGIREATGDVIIIQDSDFEYDPKEYPLVINPIFEGKAQVVYGSRFLRSIRFKGAYKQNILANKILTFISNLITGYHITDMETCYKAFKREIIQDIKICENRFGFEPEITSKLAKRKIKLIEVPISYYPRTKEQGKKIKIKDGIRALYCIIKYRFDE